MPALVGSPPESQAGAHAGPVVILMGYDMFRGSRDEQLEMSTAERGLAALIEVAERAVEKIGSSVPPAQLRALLIIDRAGSLNLNRLASQTGASASATSRLCDRMEVAGLLTRDRAEESRREISLLLTESGRRLAGWVRDQRRSALAEMLQAMTPEGRDALVRGLGEVAADAG
jgi:DNA-binding MarR family transcriptional regulator